MVIMLIILYMLIFTMWSLNKSKLSFQNQNPWIRMVIVENENSFKQSDL